MSVIQVPYLGKRPQYAHRAFTMYARGGQLVAGTWPRPRGKPKTTLEQDRLDWMKTMVREFKQSSPRTMQVAKEHAEYQRMRPQDWWLHFTNGSAFILVKPDGGMINPRRYIHQISVALDITAAAPSGMLVRGADQWRPLPKGTTGATLTMGPTLPQWSDGTMVDTISPNTPATAWVSEVLDALGDTPGMLLARASQEWIALEPGEPGQTLRMGTDGGPEWQT